MTVSCMASVFCLESVFCLVDGDGAAAWPGSDHRVLSMLPNCLATDDDMSTRDENTLGYTMMWAASAIWIVR